MTTYGTPSESDPILPTDRAHPLPGRGGWGERDWSGAKSSRALARRPFLDPCLYPLGDEEMEGESEGIGALEEKFRYLKETGVQFRDFFVVKLEGFKPQTVFMYTLLLVAILMDGFRPVAIVWSKGDGPKYPFMFSIWVILVKFLTVLFSLAMWYLANKRGETSSSLSISKRLALSVYFVIPVVCYVASDLINFVLFEHKVSPTLFACVKQSRIVLTALLFRFLMKRNISPVQWIAILQLSLASILFVAEDTSRPANPANASMKSQELTGVLWLLFKCLLDSIAVIWMDKYFKQLDEAGYPYAEQQVMFSVQSLISGVLFTAVYNYQDLFGGRRFFDGFNTGAWVSAFLTAFYGILVSLVLRYLDSMIKQFQALCSVIVTTLLDEALFGKVITLTNWVAIWFILISVFLYKLGATPHHRKGH